MPPDIRSIATALALYAAVVVSPGPNFALISRLSVAGQRSTAIAATFGLAVAATFYAILAMTGVSLLLERVAWLAGALRIAGGAYLLFLGVKSWLSRGLGTDQYKPSPAATGRLAGFRMGMLVNLLNPKGIAFFVGLYAAAVPSRIALGAKTVLLAGGFSLEIAWYGLVACLLSTGPARAAYRRHSIWIERAIGSVLAFFGTRLLLMTV